MSLETHSAELRARRPTRADAALRLLFVLPLFLMAGACCLWSRWPRVEDFKKSLQCGLSQEQVFALAVSHGARFDCGFSTDLRSCSVGRCYRFVTCAFEPGKGLVSYRESEFGPLTRAQEIERKNLCEGTQPPPRSAAVPDVQPPPRQASRLSNREERFEKKLVCGITSTEIRSAAFEFESRSFLCESKPALTCFIVFDTRSYRVRFQKERLEAFSIGQPTGMRGTAFGTEKNLCKGD